MRAFGSCESSRDSACEQKWRPPAVLSNSDAPLDSLSNDPIAVVGMSCRLAGAEDAGRFWELLEAGREAVGGV
ncbi:beta-ketoacyl synthase N-terminal-like domain-containing protein, partial [Streptomyces sp. NPDC046915]|uniref:beta-ketoacyl synthase N-terminal-like domain-containing protein n=1 Tax=Streptomyces sp. NPDC046915 TaxID=3155257 RepID=UPI0033F63B3A